MFRFTPAYCAILLAAAAGGWCFGKIDTGPFRAAPVSDSAPVSKVPDPGIRDSGAASSRFFPAGINLRAPTARWMVRALAADQGDFPDLLDQARQLFPDDPGPDGKTRAAIRWLLGLWALRNPDAAMDFANAQPDQGLRRDLGDALAMVNPAKAAAVLAEYQSGEGIGAMWDAMANRLALADPEAFLKLGPAWFSWSDKTASAFATLAKSEPRKAMDLWTFLQDEPYFFTKRSLYGLMDSLVAGDPAQAYAWLIQMADPGRRQLASLAWLSALARKDPRGALRRMKEMDLGMEEGGFYDLNMVQTGISSYEADSRWAVFTALAKLNRTEALSALAEYSADHPEFQDERDYLAGIIMAAGGDQKIPFPDDTAGFLSALEKSAEGSGGDSRWREALQMACLREQLEGRPADFALDLAKLRLAGRSADPRTPVSAGEEDEVFTTLMKHAANLDPEAVLRALPEMPDGERGRVADGIVDDALLADVALRAQALPLQSADYWARKVDGESGMLSDSADTLQKMGPAFAALTGGAAVPAVTYYSQCRSRQDPMGTLDWASTLPPETQPAAVGGAVQSWAKIDDAAASQWVNDLPAGPVRDAAAAGLVKSLADVDLPSAMAWADSVSDRATGLKILTGLAENFNWQSSGEFRQLLPPALDRWSATPEERQAVEAALDLWEKRQAEDPFAPRSSPP